MERGLGNGSMKTLRRGKPTIMTQVSSERMPLGIHLKWSLHFYASFPMIDPLTTRLPKNPYFSNPQFPLAETTSLSNHDSYFNLLWTRLVPLNPPSPSPNPKTHHEKTPKNSTNPNPLLLSLLDDLHLPNPILQKVSFIWPNSWELPFFFFYV